MISSDYAGVTVRTVTMPAAGSLNGRVNARAFEALDRGRTL